MLKRLAGLASAPALVLALSGMCGAQQAGHAQWTGTWATSPMLAEGAYSVHPFSGTTLREIAHISAGGDEIRLRFTNEYGTDSLFINDAHVALSAGGSEVKAGTDHAVTFGGQSSIRIPPGAAMYSDPVKLAVEPMADVAVSFYLPPQIMRAETFHAFANQDNYFAAGDVAGQASLANATTIRSWYYFDGVDVLAVDRAPSIVTLGDSITDGAHSTLNANRRWPDVLAGRLQADAALKHIGVLNEGIGGNRVLNDGYGPSALARLDRDVLAQDGVRYVIVLESINDIGRWGKGRKQSPDDEVDAQQLELGLKQIADAAHEHGLKIYGATLTPYGGAGYSSEKGEQIREAVNDWIRTSGTFDAVIDFDKITRDPSNPKQFNPLYDSGDHLHPNDAGYKAMGEGIDLKLFGK